MLGADADFLCSHADLRFSSVSACVTADIYDRLVVTGCRSHSARSVSCRADRLTLRAVRRTAKAAWSPSP